MADALLFEIQDVDDRMSAFYGYSGMGMGVGVNLAWLSGTDAVELLHHVRPDECR
ncbi:MAG TPA: hypothetical protein VNO32_47130 [Candidatus Acidoferrum sp.]|nr:hypothetical protein [Candidatus Acidoferrum sp.]